jgi:hypothetical protein
VPDAVAASFETKTALAVKVVGLVTSVIFQYALYTGSLEAVIRVH